MLRFFDVRILPLLAIVTSAVTARSQPGLPSVLAGCFAPPSEYAGQLGSYRSPLLFESGKQVTTRAEWEQRRKEILNQWTELMGPWPPLLAKPRMEVLTNFVRENFNQSRIRLQTAPDQAQEGWLLSPTGKGPFPAVLVVYYEPETSVGMGKEPLRDFGLELTRRGFVTLSIGTPGGNAWKPETGQAVCQPLSFHAYVAANCWQALADLPQVNSKRIGVVGHSYGGKWAMFAGALWNKFAAVAASDPGIVFDETRPNVNYWEPWYLGQDAQEKVRKAGVPSADNPRTGPYKRMVQTGRDLHELHALIAPRPFLVSGGSEDPPSRWVALNHLVAVNRLLGYNNRVAFTSRPAHTPTPQSNAQLYAFFEHFLKAEPVGTAALDPDTRNPGLPWPATDALGRSLPLADETGTPKANRFVGIFYFLWHNEPGQKSPLLDGPYDIAKILQRDPDALKHPESPLWGGIGTSHYWGEPLYGYYRSNDPWVLRRHAQLLADAGIDTLIFDTTNARSYPDVYMRLCEVFRQVRQEGGRTPQIVFMVNTRAGETAREIYDNLYKPGLFPELWFRWHGKPLMICDPAQASDELKAFFTLRRAHWPFTLTNTPYAWHWEAAYPQPYGYTDDPGVPEQVNVSVAQNLRQKDGKVTNMSAGDARGRSFHADRQETGQGAVNWGYNFQEQWQRAFELQPPFVMVTGWNEWIAGRWGKLDGPLVFVDQFDEECSRDIEPMKGGHGDNYYYQLVANVRRYKGAPALPKPSGPKTIAIPGPFDQWRDVQPQYEDHAGETQKRDFAGVGGCAYQNVSGRNDLATFKVARDRTNIYFYARSRESLSPATEAGWMWLFIDADQDPKTGWNGYDFIVNRSIDADGRTWLEHNTGGWHWEKVAATKLHVLGNELHFALPRRALGLPVGSSAAKLDFKWADHLPDSPSEMDFYSQGDVAPEGRFNYRYTVDN